MTLQALLAAAQGQLIEHLALDRTAARLETRLLLQQALNVDHAWLITHANDSCGAAQTAAFQTLLGRRLAGEPIAYILGQREFYGLTLTVSSATLIPRPDTEALVAAALQRIPPHAACRVLDLGTGSGAIALALAAQRPRATVTAVDHSSAALAVARHNAKQLGLQNVQFQHGNWFSQLQAMSFDIIVSNPPYIAADDPHLQQGDLRFEPITALASGADGLDDIRTISAQAANHLAPSGWLMLEHGYLQGAAVRDILQQNGLANIRTVADLAGHERVTLGSR